MCWKLAFKKLAINRSLLIVAAMEKIQNFRDAAIGNMNKEMVYRSATLDLATKKDQMKIVHELKIKTIIDLRSSQEIIKRDSEDGHIHDYYQSSTRQVIKLDLSFILKYVIWKSLGLYIKFWVILYTFCGYRSKAEKLAIENSVLKRGLVALNITVLDHAGEYLKKIFTILANKESYPILIHCSVGKDRTGLTVALLQSIVNAPRIDIIDQYSKSAQFLDRDLILWNLKKTGLGPDFADSDPETMQQTLTYIDTKYGSVEKYLLSIGVAKEQQEQIRMILQGNQIPKL
jgi:protein tyrosine/serine phosphatase